ncbi:MAG: prolipoprotein diacylglyceryl transferase family protein [Candidatus Neomarinimicrobiota bacterium]
MYYPEINIFGYTFSTWLIFGWFNVFIAKICFIVLGMRRGIPLSLMLNLTLLLTLGGALGAIIAPSIMSVIIFSALFFYLGKLILNINQPLGDLLAINYALAIGIGRLGCLLNGCCFGTVTNLPWGVAYPAGTLPHRLHSAAAYIDNFASATLAVHPVPLYETMFLLICALILYLCRKKMTAWRAISLPLFLGVYCLFRIVMEQIRAHTNVWWSVLQFGPLSALQWLLLVSATLLFAICILMKSKKALILRTARRFNFEQSQLILLSASLVMTVILRSRLFEIHQVQLGLLWLSGAAIYAANILEIRFQRWVPITGWSLTLIIVLVFPFYSGLQGQLPVHQGQLSGTQQHSGIVYNTWHSESNKLVRLGEEQLYPARFHTINSYLNLTTADTLTERQFIERLNENWRTEHYLSVAGGYFQIETCGGVDPYGYFGAAYGIQALKATGNGQEIGIFNRIALQQHLRTSTKLELSANSIIHFDWPYSGLGFGISATTLEIDQGVNVLPAAHLRLGSLGRHLSVGFMDQTMLATEPWYGHISWNWISTDSVRFQLGLSNFSYVFAFYLSAQNQKTGWTYYILPPLDSETMGFGLRLTHHF